MTFVEDFMSLKTLLLLPVLALLAFPTADACTTISYKDLAGDSWMLKSFDYHNDQGYAFLNKRGVRKIGLNSEMQKSKVWVSKYASITFNQVGRDMSYGGMNEAGLSMEIMWLDAAIFPAPDDRPRVNEAQVIQYVLDTAASTEEAIRKIEFVSIDKAFAPVHYMICDRSDDCRTVEYLDEVLVVTPMASGVERILQNTVYAQDLESIREKKGTERVAYDDLQSIFDLSSKSTPSQIVDHSFEKLDAVISQDNSVWQIVYNLDARSVWFKQRGQANVHFADFAGVDLNCTATSTSVVSNIAALSAGEKVQWVEFTDKIMDAMLATLTEFPPQLVEAFRQYSKNSSACTLQ